MGIWKNIEGVMASLFRIGGPSGITIKENTGVVELRNAADSAFVLGRGLLIPATGETVNDLVALLDLQGRVAVIEFDFTGASPPGAGTNTGKFGFCHTTGGGYTAGDVVYDDGTSLIDIPAAVCKHLTSSNAVTGTVSLIANGFYALQAGTWTLKGDGGGTGTGRVQSIEVTIGTSASYNSTTQIPDGARVLNTRLVIETAYDNSATIIVKVDGTADENLLLAAENDPSNIDEYQNEAAHKITSSNEGVVNVAISATPTVGAGYVVVDYVTPLA
jgi:hypothetical protein